MYVFIDLKKKSLVISFRKNYKHLVNSEEFDIDGIKVYKLARNKFH